MIIKKHLALCAVTFSLFTGVVYSQAVTAPKLFSLKGFEIGESCTSAKNKLFVAMRSKGDDLYEARIDMQMVALSCPENHPSTPQDKVLHWHAAFGPRTDFGDSSLSFTFSPDRKLIGLTLHQSWSDLDTAPLLELVYKQLSARYGRPYFAVAFGRQLKEGPLGPFHNSYWSSNRLNPTKTIIQKPYNVDCINRPAMVNPNECGTAVFERMAKERNKAKASATGVLANVILSHFEGMPMRTKVLHIEVVDVAQMASAKLTDADAEQRLKDHFKKLEDSKIPKF